MGKKMSFALLGVLIAQGVGFNAYAKELVIADCKGMPRAIHQVDADSTNRIAVNLLDRSGAPANNVEVTLTDSTTGTVRRAISKDGVATFDNITAGNWNMCNGNADLLSKVAFIPGEASSANIRTAALVGAGVAGGAALIIGSSHSGGSDSSDSALPGDLSTVSGSEKSATVSHTTSSSSSKKSTRPLAEEDCLNSDSATAISPFL